MNPEMAEQLGRFIAYTDAGAPVMLHLEREMIEDGTRLVPGVLSLRAQEGLVLRIAKGRYILRAAVDVPLHSDDPNAP